MPSDGDAVPGGFEVGRLASVHAPLVVGSVGWLLFGGKGLRQERAYHHLGACYHIVTSGPVRDAGQARQARLVGWMGWMDGWMDGGGVTSLRRRVTLAGAGCQPAGRQAAGAIASFGKGIATWLILPVVICLSQRLSHACVSINSFVL